jgi:uncharacterized Zn finger protein
MAESTEHKARRLIETNRVTVVTDAANGQMTARVKGDSAIWDVVRHDDHWSCTCTCTCPSRTRCSHMRATVIAARGEQDQ